MDLLGLKFTVNKVVYFDLTKRRRPDVQQLADLKKGRTLVHDHEDYDTPMRVWISQQRRRLKRDFEVSPIMPGNGQEPTEFKIWWTRRWRRGQRHKASRAVSPHALKLIHANTSSTGMQSLNGTGNTALKKARGPGGQREVAGPGLSNQLQYRCAERTVS